MGAAPDPSGIPPQGLSHILGADAWWEGGQVILCGCREGLYVSTSLYIFPFPSSALAQPLWIEDGKGKQEALAVQGVEKSHSSQGEVSLTHTVLIPG